MKTPEKYFIIYALIDTIKTQLASFSDLEEAIHYTENLNRVAKGTVRYLLEDNKGKVVSKFGKR